MVEKTFNLTWNNHLANLSGLFEGLYKSGLLTDATLACQDGTLKAHRLVLAACSPYFERVFKQHYGEQPILILKGVATQEMECLLDFMYRGSIDVTEDHLPSLIKIATELEIRGLSADHQNETANSSSGMQRNNLKLSPQPNSTSEENISATANLTPDDMTTTHHIKVEEIEVEDDPMIIDTHEDFEHSLPSTEKPTRPNQSSASACKRETRFKGKKRVCVGRITRSSDFINVKHKSLCIESASSLRNTKLDSRFNNSCSDPTVPEIQMHHDNLHGSESIDLFTAADDVQTVKKFDTLKRGEVGRNTGNSLRIDKKQYKPYSCDLCTLAFTRASHLARHRRVHTGERPFACTLCPRMFARQDKLKQHLDSHFQWTRKRTFDNEAKLVPVKGKRGRPRKVTVEQSAFEEILKFGEFSSMLNKSQSMNMKNDNRLEESEKSTDTEDRETSTSKKNDKCTYQVEHEENIV